MRLIYGRYESLIRKVNISHEWKTYFQIGIGTWILHNHTQWKPIWRRFPILIKIGHPDGSIDDGVMRWKPHRWGYRNIAPLTGEQKVVKHKITFKIMWKERNRRYYIHYIRSGRIITFSRAVAIHTPRRKITPTLAAAVPTERKGWGRYDRFGKREIFISRQEVNPPPPTALLENTHPPSRLDTFLALKRANPSTPLTGARRVLNVTAVQATTQ